MTNADTDGRFLVPFNDSTSGEDAEQRLRRAFACNQFVLYGQTIMRLGPVADPRSHFEVFVRLLEEEQNLIPPGSFLPLLDQLKLGPELDRYVIRKLADWFAIKREENKTGVAHINVCEDTFGDPNFCGFVEVELRRTGLKGDCLCFEFPSNNPRAPIPMAALAKGLLSIGCKISVGAAEDENIHFDKARKFGASYLKLGRSIVHGVTQDKSAAVEVGVAARACRTFEIQTIAQHVEDASTLDALRKLQVGFAQGFGVAKPGPLRDQSKQIQN